ncbi:MAG: TonB family protein [Myxococcales bacterium]|nr:TonB family protein [Myxococcales bacterium]
MKTTMTLLVSMIALMTLPMFGATAQAGGTQKAEVEGDLAKDKIRDVVRAHLGEVRDCYDDVLAVDPMARAKLVIDFTIGGDGVVTKSAVGAGSDGPAQLGECVSKAVRTWKFPAPSGGGDVKVTYPFLFEPG